MLQARSQAYQLADKAAAVVKKSKRVQQGLLLLAVLGTSMTIGDGVMTAAASGAALPQPCVSRDTWHYAHHWAA